MFEYKAEVVRVIDGDTLVASIDLGFHFWFRNQTVRLFGIDTPEIKSRDKDEVRHGELSKSFVEKFCWECGGNVILRTEIEDVVTANKEKFGRILGHVVNPANGYILNSLLIANYLAVPYFGEGKQLVQAAHLENRKKLEKKLEK